MAYFNPRDYFPTLQEWIRYGCDITWDDYSIMTNHGDIFSCCFRPPLPRDTIHMISTMMQTVDSRRCMVTLAMQDLKEQNITNMRS